MREAPDSGWLDFLKMTLEFLVVLAISTLAAVIALGHVEAQTSFGLDIIIGGLLTIVGGFCNWAFGSSGDSEREIGLARLLHL